MVGAIVCSGFFNGGFYPSVALGILGSLVAASSLIILVIFQKKALSVSRVRSVGRRTFLWIVNFVGVGICALGSALEFESTVLGIVCFGSLLIAEFSTVMMEKRTKQSAELLGKLLGLRQFIETAELDRLHLLVDENPSYFYDVLPYAYVMGLTDKWAKNFEKIRIVQPDWYYGNTGDELFNAWMFSSMMRNCYHAAASNIHISIPEGGDSGGGFSSGGGGFSGGGFGGGGGGSW